ncbi:MAG: aldehyde dehydrogenase [Halobacterium sp.]
MGQEAMRRRERLYVGGEWVAGPDTFPVTDLADGGTFAEVAAADRHQADRALAAAAAAEPTLRETTVPERCEWLQAIADGLRDRKSELAEVVVREAGKPISSARGEVDSAAERFERAIEEARHLKGEYRQGTTSGHDGWEAIVKPEPIGTVLCITPYNYPLATTALQVAPALAAGNAVVLKPASKTPVSAGILAEIVAEAGLPDGAFNFVPGRASEIGDELAGDDRVNAIAMTGSSGAGKHVARESGMVNLHMELGGNAPAVVFEDADLADASAAAAKGSLKYAGQRCSAVSRVLAHESVHDDLVDRIEADMGDWVQGDLFEEDTDLGPLISADQADWVEELVEDALDRGATLVEGGDRYEAAEGVHVFEPTLLADVPKDARIVNEEQFGPVCAVTSFEDDAEALEIANGPDLALDACVFTADYDRAMTMAERVDAGAVRINGAPSHGLGDIPFGGNEDSGIGREGLDKTIEEFVREKSIIL